ncbi:MAG: thiazole synthase [Nitrospinae bacterium]|nr:thiazole synthase [Nitrospinota bacterium]
MDRLTIGGKTFTSRLFIGTGKFPSPEIMKQSIEAAQTEMVTVALRRIDLNAKYYDILDYINPEKYLILPNTSGAKDAEEAIRLARMAKASGISDWIKLEVTPDVRFLLPDPVETLKAAEILVKEGFTVLPYINADPVLAKKLSDVGTAAVMPLGAPIGTNQGIRTRNMLEIIIEQSTVPVVVDAGIGLPSHASEAMEMGADAVLVNTAIAIAGNPVLLADAFKMSVIAGRNAYLSKPSTPQFEASASSPLTGFLNE